MTTKLTALFKFKKRQIRLINDSLEDSIFILSIFIKYIMPRIHDIGKSKKELM